ncbi:MFS transporter [Streptomyces sp. NBC_00083]|uniref:MFS transporter n=1 Tax=Streptomyces sp. NBC_00083 TaxID=2975647 RepID=UPI002252B384|nr:MFS transporter [Streptomyces sp. NBC_00083]MCX5384286.1 MFS transporter [Streptomyces sp. NBC_00083]
MYGVGGRSLGREFGWLWAACGVSTVGTMLAFDAFPMIAIVVLHAGPAAVSALAAAGLAAGAVIAVPLGPWVEFRRKRPVMIATDLIRFAAVISVPAAFALGRLGFAQLVVVSVVVCAADIAFRAASGACLKAVVPPEGLLTANGRFESTAWTATMVGPPLGGLAIALFGPVTTVTADAVSYLLSALGIRAIGREESAPPARPHPRTTFRRDDLLEGWRHILGHPTLRPLFFNTVLVNGLIMATVPPLASLMLGPLGFALWQYGLAFGAPCIGGLIGARLSRRLVARHGQHRVMMATGVLRACWVLGLVLVRPGVVGLVLVATVELGLITSCGIFNPVFSTYRLEQTGTDRVARTLSAWTVTGKAATAAMTGLWGALAGLAGPRAAIATAGVLMLATPLLLPRHARVPRQQERETAPSGV